MLGVKWVDKSRQAYTPLAFTCTFASLSLVSLNLFCCLTRVYEGHF